MPDMTDLFIACEKIKRGGDAAIDGWNIDVCPYMDEMDIAAWRFGYKLAKYQIARKRQRIAQERVRENGMAQYEEARLRYMQALGALQEEIPATMDIKL